MYSAEEISGRFIITVCYATMLPRPNPHLLRDDGEMRTNFVQNTVTISL
jgi:hypothetical protein